MKNLFIITTLIMLLLASCKQDELILTHKRSGVLTVQLNDTTGTPIANAKLILSRYSEEIQELETDTNGFVNFGSLMEGHYTIAGEDIKDGEQDYSFNRAALVSSAQETNITIVPSDYSASIHLTLREKTIYDSYAPLGSDVKIALLKYVEDAYMHGSFIEDVKKEFIEENTIKSINADGVSYGFKFDNIPLQDYIVLIYTDVNYSMKPLRFRYIKKGDIKTHEETIYSPDIRKYEVNQSFYITRWVYDSSYNSSLVAYPNCKIQIIFSNDYNNPIYSNINDFAFISKRSVASGITDANGNATFKVPSYRYIIALYYAPDNTFLGESKYIYNTTSSQDIEFTVY